MNPKLVRDKIPEIIKANGEGPVTHVATDTEYEQTLRDKLREEVHEYFTDPSLEELADIQEVINALAALHEGNLEKVRRQKREERGGFEKRIILDTVSTE